MADGAHHGRIRPLIAALLLAGALAAQTEGLLEQADAAFRAGDPDKAAALASRVLARDPGAVHAHMILGVIAAQKNDWAVSNRHFQAIVRLDPANPYGYFYLGQAKLYEREWEAAVQYFSKALDRQYPDRDRLTVELALAHNEAGRPERALELLGGIASPDERLAAQYHAVQAFALDRLGQPVQAINAMRAALESDDSRPDYWEFLISTLIKSDRAPHALGEAIRAQSKFPDNAEVQYLFALASYHVNESPLSHLALRNLREAAPDDPRVLLAEGLLDRKQGENEKATAAFEKAAQRGVPDAHLLLGIVYRENGDYQAAEKECREAERLNPRSGQVLFELGKLLFTRGALEEARVRLEKAAQLMPDTANVHYQLGLLYRRLGQTEKSQEHFRLSKRD